MVLGAVPVVPLGACMCVHSMKARQTSNQQSSSGCRCQQITQTAASAGPNPAGCVLSYLMHVQPRSIAVHYGSWPRTQLGSSYNVPAAAAAAAVVGGTRTGVTAGSGRRRAHGGTGTAAGKGTGVSTTLGTHMHCKGTCRCVVQRTMQLICGTLNMLGARVTAQEPRLPQ